MNQRRFKQLSSVIVMVAVVLSATVWARMVRRDGEDRPARRRAAVAQLSPLPISLPAAEAQRIMISCPL